MELPRHVNTCVAAPSDNRRHMMFIHERMFCFAMLLTLIAMFLGHGEVNHFRALIECRPAITSFQQCICYATDETSPVFSLPENYRLHANCSHQHPMINGQLQIHFTYLTTALYCNGCDSEFCSLV
jgi:hypothetical protein